MSTDSITSPKRERLLVQDDSAISHLMDTAKFEHMIRIAGAMAGASLIPEHLWCRKKGGEIVEEFSADQVRANCFLIVNQSLRWGFDPFAVMPETYVVGGKLAYQGKLIAAVINARAPLSSRLNYSFTGKEGNDDFTVTISGSFQGESKPREVTLSVGKARTSNEMWKKDPEQKLIYSGVVKWARRHCPEIVLGIITDDDAERMGERQVDGRIVETVPATSRIVEAAATDTASEPESPTNQTQVAEEPVSIYDQLSQLMDRDKMTFAEIVALATASKMTKGETNELHDLPPKAATYMVNNWPGALEWIAKDRKAKGGAA